MTGYRVVIGLTAGTLSGVDVFSANLARGLNARGIPAHVLLSSPFRHRNPLPVPTDVPCHELGSRRDEPWGSRWSKMIHYLESQAPCVYLPNYDYEHSCVSPKLSPAVRIVGIVHSDDPVHYEHVRRLGRFWDAIVAVSPEVAGKTLALGLGLAERLVTIPYGVDLPEALPQRPDDQAARLRVVYAGRLEQSQKRVLDLVPIFERLWARRVPVELTIIGDGPSRDALALAADGLIANGVLRLLGTLPNGRVLEAFDRSDVVILTSGFEGMPVCLLEAMGRGCVPVVTDLRSGIPELVADGLNGFRVPAGDGDAFADRLALLQADPVRRRAMSLRAFQTVRERGFDARRMVDRYESLFERVLEQSRTGGYRRPWGRILSPSTMDATWKDHLPPHVRAMGTRVTRLLRVLSPTKRDDLVTKP